MLNGANTLVKPLNKMIRGFNLLNHSEDFKIKLWEVKIRDKLKLVTIKQNK
jgi:hypothetical protein